MGELKSAKNVTSPKFWNDKYKKSISRYHLSDPYYGQNGLLAKTLLPKLEKENDVLELGCGNSRYLMFFNLVGGLKTHGIDYSKEGIEQLEQMATLHNIRHHLIFNDMFHEDVEGRKFDLVFHAGLVEHFEQLAVFFERCRFFCRPDGHLIFLMPNMHNVAWKLHKYLCPSNFSAHIPYTSEQVCEALSLHFSDVRCQSWGVPQLYAGGPPEKPLAYMLKYFNLFGMLCFLSLSPWYKGYIGSRFASTWLFEAKAR